MFLCTIVFERLYIHLWDIKYFMRTYTQTYFLNCILTNSFITWFAKKLAIQFFGICLTWLIFCHLESKCDVVYSSSTTRWQFSALVSGHLWFENPRSDVHICMSDCGRLKCNLSFFIHIGYYLQHLYNFHFVKFSKVWSSVHPLLLVRKYQPIVISETWSLLQTHILLINKWASQLVSVRHEWGFQKFALLSVSHLRAMQKMSQFRRLKLEEVKVLAEEGIELNAVDYQRQVEEREAQRRQEREERLAREAMMTLQAMEQQEQKATAPIHNEGTNRKGLLSV